MKSPELTPPERRVLRFSEQNGLLPPGSRVVCALSGGADSVCLACMLQRLSGALSLRLEAVHVNHGIRGAEADRDEAFCRRFCGRRGIPLRVFRGSAPELAEREKRSPEDAARVLRYGFFKTLDCDRIAVAHNADDNLETVLWHLVRGSGARGLSGIPPENGKIVRPCMCLTRAETEAYCRAQGEAWVTDSTNLSDDCTRNRLRHRVLPALRAENPAAAELVLAASLRLRQEDCFLETLAAERLKRGGGRLTAALFADAGPVLSRRMLRLCAAERGADCDGETTERLLALSLSGKSRFCVPVPGGYYRGEYGVFSFEAKGAPEGKAPSEAASRLPVAVPVPREAEKPQVFTFPAEAPAWRITAEKIQGENEIIYKKFNTFLAECDKINGRLVLRLCEGTDLFQRNSGSGKKPLRRVFSDLKLPAADRKTRPVVSDDSGVLFVPGVGYNFMYSQAPRQGECLSLTFEKIEKAVE